MPLKETPVRTRLLRNSIFDHETGCWNWSKALRNGYGQIQIPTGKTGGRSCGAHRESWKAFHGPIPDGLCVLHKCDNPRCVRPDHLFLGTSKDNIHDMIAKGRRKLAVGERSGTAKLTTENIRTIREMYSHQRISQMDLAKEFGVSRPHISDIVNRKRWRHLC